MSKNFTIKKGTPLVGSLKPSKVAIKKTYSSAIGITPAGTSSLNGINTKVPINNSK